MYFFHKVTCFCTLLIHAIYFQTSNAVASILYQLSLHQEKQANLYDEVKKLLPDSDTELTHEKLDRMQYLKACVKETMRFAARCELILCVYGTILLLECIR